MAGEKKMSEKQTLETRVLIIGGGVTGTGIARDLALRGIPAIVLEKETINAGASGRNHGLLHSGARYVASDPASAEECRAEGNILKKIAPHCIEETNGLFVAIQGDDEDYIHRFEKLCRQVKVPCEALSAKQALELEPLLSKKIVAAFMVKDASVEPFHISLENMSQAVEKGARYFNYFRVEKFFISGGTIWKTRARNLLNKQVMDIEADIVINAAGAWSGQIADLAGIRMDMVYSKGSLLVTHDRMTHHVINRLRPPDDGDILVPGGTVSIFGTTSVRVNCPDRVRPSVDEAKKLVRDAKTLVPRLENTRYIRAYAGVRPLTGGSGSKSGTDDRAVSRGFSLVDHAGENRNNFITITGGKMTTFRLMAEKAADLAAKKLGVLQTCRTHRVRLKSGAPTEMTEAGMSVRLRSQKKDPGDMTMCECEIITRGQFNRLISWLKKRKKKADLNTLRIHSRLGKGACQGTFCSQRVTAFMYDEDYLKEDDGIHNIKDLLEERFLGQRPVLWGAQLAQAELNEALFCGFYGLEFEKSGSG